MNERGKIESPGTDLEQEDFSRRELFEKVKNIALPVLLSFGITFGRDRVMQEKIARLQEEIVKPEVNWEGLVTTLEEMKEALTAIKEKTDQKFFDAQSLFDTLIDTITYLKTGEFEKIEANLAELDSQQKSLLEMTEGIGLSVEEIRRHTEQIIESLGKEFSPAQKEALSKIIEPLLEQIAIDHGVNEEQSREIEALRKMIEADKAENEKQSREIADLHQKIDRLIEALEGKEN